MKLIYIHGANATGNSFSYIRDRIKGDDIVIDYNSQNGFDNNLNDMIDLIRNFEKLFFIAHSLGGVYALHLANYYLDRTCGGVTISTPYGGSREADFVKFFMPFNKLVNDVGVNSPPIQKLKTFKIPSNWTAIVTTAGNNSMIHEENDGIVTLKSMRAIKEIPSINVSLNHYEVVISDLTVNIIQEKLLQAVE